MLMRRAARGNEMNFVQMKAALGGARHGQMADVNGIESAAEKRDAPRAALVRVKRRVIPAERCSTVLFGGLLGTRALATAFGRNDSRRSFRESLSDAPVRCLRGGAVRDIFV